MRRYLPALGLLAALNSVYGQPVDAEARRALAAGRVEEALSLYGKLAREFPRSPAWEDQVGFILAASKRPHEAIPHFERSIAIDPAFGEAYYHLGVALWLTGERENALPSLVKACELKPDDEAFRLRLGSAYLELSRYHDAEREFVELSRRRPSNSKAWQNLGMARQQLRDYAGARDAYEKALEIEPSNDAVRNSFGFMLVNTRQADEGIEQFRRILKDHPGELA